MILNSTYICNSYIKHEIDLAYKAHHLANYAEFDFEIDEGSNRKYYINLQMFQF